MSSDGRVIDQIKRKGIRQIILSAEKNPVLTARGMKLGIEVIQGSDDKNQICSITVKVIKLIILQFCIWVMKSMTWRL